jgi:hypothetical protein
MWLVKVVRDSGNGATFGLEMTYISFGGMWRLVVSTSRRYVGE